MSLFGKRIATGVKKLLLAAGLMLSVISLSAQTANRISLAKQRLPLSELLREVERQTGMIVVTNADRMDITREIVVSGTSGTVGELLTQALAGTGHSWQVNGRYIIISRAAKPKPPVTLAPQPTREEFERDVRHYSQSNISVDNGAGQLFVRYDTVRTERPHDGIFRYPAREVIPEATKRAVPAAFSRSTPPLVAVKTNLVWWAARGTPNISAEIGLSKRISLEVAGGNNRWNLEGSEANNRKTVHWVIKPEFRYWLCERFNGHFFGVHGFYGKYNVGGYDIPLLFEREYRYEGDAWGVGVNYGYHLALAKRWGLEFTAGVGVMRMDYVKSECEMCGIEVGRFQKTYFGPTNLGVKVVFMIK